MVQPVYCERVPAEAVDSVKRVLQAEFETCVRTEETELDIENVSWTEVCRVGGTRVSAETKDISVLMCGRSQVFGRVVRSGVLFVVPLGGHKIKLERYRED
jgi:hypothetical protein